MNFDPVVVSGAIVGLIMAGLAMAVSLKWINLDDTQMSSVQAFVVALVGLAVPIVAALILRRQVTPISNPKTKDGEPAVLIPQSQVTPAMMAALGQPENKTE